MRRFSQFAFVLALTSLVLLIPSEAHAYVGPGAGIAVATTGFMLVVSLFLAIFGILFWPFRWVFKQATRKRAPKPAKIKRAVLIGLDGLDPKLVRTMLAEGKLPNMQKIADKGGFQNLGTTFPAMSPVAWSSFATGVNPAKHGIFDFLTRDRKTYAPDLSSADVRGSTRDFRVGDLIVPLGKPQIKLLRKSLPFWKVLGQHQIPCSILRVPITFPPEKFHGTMLSAMCVPDLQGTQGSFSYYTSATDDGDAIGGARFKVDMKDGVVNDKLIGPPNPMRVGHAPTTIPFKITIAEDKKSAAMVLDGKKIHLGLNEYTEWIPVAFPLALGAKLRGICRFRLMDVAPFKLYVTPINIDPENPILPISHPKFFATYLAKLLGSYATLGLAEDTWALNEGVIDEDAFLEQAWNNHEERESMFFEMLKRTPTGLITCVFDGTDRIQHMFTRFMDDGHPAMRDDDRKSEYKDVIPDTYAKMDEMVGKVLEKVDIDDPANMVMVLSDHGFQTFRRGVNLNSWLLANGYLKLLDPDAKRSGDWLTGVDWKNTTAYGVGLGGIFLNIEGRERDGLVKESDANALADEICAKLDGLMDEEVDAVAVRKCYPAYKLYDGPYAEDAPDIIVGYAAGWRASWDGVRGIAHDVIFDDNTKAWSGDHCIDPDLVPGVLICNRKMGKADGSEANIADMAPTMLDLFGIPAPRYMDGKSLNSPKKAKEKAPKKEIAA